MAPTDPVAFVKTVAGEKAIVLREMMVNADQEKVLVRNLGLLVNVLSGSISIIYATGSGQGINIEIVQVGLDQRIYYNGSFSRNDA